MRKFFHRIALPALCICTIFSTGFIGSASTLDSHENTKVDQPLTVDPDTPIVIFSDVEEDETITEPETEEQVEEEVLLQTEDVELIALVTMAEAEGECEQGKRLVIDTILNRMDSPYFPDTAHDVIYQRGQFSSMWNGRVKKCYVRDDICQLVREEYASRINDQVVFFTARRYGKYGTPLFRVEHHYFSSL